MGNKSKKSRKLIRVPKREKNYFLYLDEYFSTIIMPKLSIIHKLPQQLPSEMLLNSPDLISVLNESTINDWELSEIRNDSYGILDYEQHQPFSKSTSETPKKTFRSMSTSNSSRSSSEYSSSNEDFPIATMNNSYSSSDDEKHYADEQLNTEQFKDEIKLTSLIKVINKIDHSEDIKITNENKGSEKEEPVSPDVNMSPIKRNFYEPPSFLLPTYGEPTPTSSRLPSSTNKITDCTIKVKETANQQDIQSNECTTRYYNPSATFSSISEENIVKNTTNECSNLYSQLMIGLYMQKCEQDISNSFCSLCRSYPNLKYNINHCSNE